MMDYGELKESRALRLITETREYRMGYEAGYREGISRALGSTIDIIKNASNPKIIVTTEENMSRLKKELNK